MEVLEKHLGDPSTWLASDGMSFTPAGEHEVIARAWDLVPDILRQAGDGGICDATVETLEKRMPSRDLNLLACETLEIAHGYSWKDDIKESRIEDFNDTDIEKNTARYQYGPLSPAAAASRRLLLASLLRCSPAKRAPFLEMGLPQLCRYLFKPGIYGHEAAAETVGEATERLVAIANFVQPLAEAFAKEQSESLISACCQPFRSTNASGLIARHAAALMSVLLSTAAAAGPPGAGGFTEDVPVLRGLWESLLSLTLWGINCPGQENSATHLFSIVDQDFLLTQPFRYAHARWEKKRHAQAKRSWRRKRRTAAASSSFDSSSAALDTVGCRASDGVTDNSASSTTSLAMLSVGRSRAVHQSYFQNAAASVGGCWSSLGIARLVYYALARNSTAAVLSCGSESNRGREGPVKVTLQGSFGMPLGAEISLPAIAGVGVYSPLRLWQLLAPHAATLLFRADDGEHGGIESISNESGEEERSTTRQRLLASSDAMAGEELLLWLTLRLPPNCLHFQEYMDGDSPIGDNEEVMLEESDSDSGFSSDEGSASSLSIESRLQLKTQRRNERLKQEAKQPIINIPRPCFNGEKSLSKSFYFRPAVNISGLLRSLIDRMVFCADAYRRARLRLVAERMIGALDGAAAYVLFSDPGLISVCPHTQAAAWLLDLVRRRVVIDFKRLYQWNEERRQCLQPKPLIRFNFLGDSRLHRLVTQPLQKIAAETQIQKLSESLDVHLSVLATARFVLLRRKSLLQSSFNLSVDEELSRLGLIGRNDVCSDRTIEAWGVACRRVISTLVDYDINLRTKTEKTALPLPLVTFSIANPDQKATSTTQNAPLVPPSTVMPVEGELAVPIAPEPTPHKENYHFALLVESATCVLDLLQEKK